MQAQIARIRRLPKLYDDVLRAEVKRDAAGVMGEFRTGIMKGTFGFEPLKPKTIARKKAQGLPKPDFPLYGIGPSDMKSYMNMLEIKKLKSGWKVTPSKKKHHTKKITLDHLFQIHEYGAIVKRKTKDGIKLIRIPPRPALTNGYERWMIKRRRMEPKPAIEVKKAITQFITDGNATLVTKIKKRRIEGVMRGLHEL